MHFPIYLDHAATTPVAPEVVEAMLPYFTESFGNPSALYSVAMMAKEAVEMARESIAETLNASPEEIVFTSGGTEADNTALYGIARSQAYRGKHILTTPIEHHAILDPLETLSHLGYEVEMIPLDATGRVKLDEFVMRLRDDTILVSVMHANNEIGTIQPLTEIGALCRERKIWFHTDAVQTFGKIPIDVRAMKIDLLSVSAHKLHGPKGVGVLYVRRGTPLVRFQEGGQQEKGRRAGTLNVPGIVGIGKAAELARARMTSEAARQTALRDAFIADIERTIPGVHLNGSRVHRLPNNINLCLEGIQGEPVLLALDEAGICASAGSACSAGSNEPSHVLKAIGVSRELARGSLRLTLGPTTTQEALDYTRNHLERITRELRSLSASGTREVLAAGVA